jgi:hypothetical protein
MMGLQNGTFSQLHSHPAIQNGGCKTGDKYITIHK